MALLSEASPALRQKAGALALIVFDVDGVMTDGRFTLDHKGREYKTFHTQDGFGLRALARAGIEIGVITGRRSTALDHRMRDLDIRHVFHGVSDKRSVIESLLQTTGLAPAQAAAVGDDVPDIAMFDAVGLSFAVANAVAAVRRRADLTTHVSGGLGAVREICDFVLAARSEVMP